MSPKPPVKDSQLRIEKKTAEAIDREGWMHSGDKDGQSQCGQSSHSSYVTTCMYTYVHKSIYIYIE